MDQLKYHVVFNLSTIDFSSLTDSTFRFSSKLPGQPSVQLDRVKYMAIDSRRPSIPADLVVSFVSKANGRPFNLSSSNFGVVRRNQDLLIKVNLSSSDPTINLKIGDFQTVVPPSFLPVLNLVTSIFGSLMTLYSVYLLIKNEQLHFMISSSYQSATLLSILYFMLFLTYITLGLQYFPRFGIYTQFLTMSGVACFLASLSMNRLGVMFFLAQYANHPLIMETSWASPRTKYHLISNLLLMVAGIVALVLSKYPAYSYFILPFYLYPLLHIWRSAQLRTKKSFLWYFQLIVWIPSITHPIFIRGSANNYLTLVPWPALQYILIFMMAFMVGFLHQVFVSWLQSYLGPQFFIPKFLRPGHFEYERAVSSLTAEQAAEECPICYTPINQNPFEEANPRHSDSSAHEEPLVLAENKYCFVTPCKHNFHRECLTKWFENKPECPVCRKPLPYLE